MPFGLEVQGDDIPGLVAATGLLVFAVWLVLLDPTSRLHRALAAFFVLRAGFLASVRLGENIYTLGGRMSGYFAIAVPFAAVYFGLVYAARFQGAASRRRLPGPAIWFLVPAAVVCEFLYFLNHDWFFAGWLGLSVSLIFVSFATASALLAYEALRPKTPPTARRALFLGSLGLALEPAYQITWQLSESATEILVGAPWRAQYLIPTVFADHLVKLAGLVLLWTTTVALWRRADLFAAAERRAYAGTVAAACVLAVPLSAFFALQLVAASRPGVDLGIAVHRIVDGFWLLSGLAVVTFSVLRYQLFNIHWKLNLAIRGTTLAGMFFALLFVISEGLQVVFQNVFASQSSSALRNASSILGVLGAGVFVFALHPVQRFAERIAHRAVPSAKPLSKMSHPDRVRLYREQAEFAWLDGQLQRKERLLLDGLRRRLGLSAEEGASIESKALERRTGIGFENRALATSSVASASSRRTASEPRRASGRRARSDRVASPGTREGRP